MALLNTGWIELTNFSSNGSGTAFSSPGNASTEDGSTANASNIPTGGGLTDYLDGVLLSPTISAGAEIKGIEARIKRRDTNISNTGLKDNAVSMIIGGSYTGDNKASATVYPDALTWSGTYGSSTDLWGITGLFFDTKMNATDTGLSLRAINPGSPISLSNSAYVDAFELTIHYNPTGMFLSM